MQTETKNYLDTLCGQIRWKKARCLVREELKGHIEENKKEGESKGMSKNEAEIKAAQAMGDPIEVGRMMDRLHRPKTDILFVVSIAVLMFYGLMILERSIFHIGGIESLFAIGPEWILFRVIGIALFLLCIFVNFRWLLKKNIFIIFSGVTGGAGLVYMNLTNAEYRVWPTGEWFAFISYICICLLVITFAGVLSRLQKKSWIAVIAAVGIAVASGSIMLFRENAPRIITMCLLVSLAVMFWFTNIKILWKIIASAAIASFIFIYLLNLGFFYALFDHPDRMGMLSKGEAATLKESLVNVQMIGQAPAPGLAEMMNGLYLAYVNIMVYILLKFGILPAAILLAAVGVLIWRMISACIRIRDTQGRVLASGLAVFITIAVTGTLLLNLLFIGTSGTYMPFLQAIGPEFVLYSVFTGLIAGLYRRKELYSANDTVLHDSGALTDTETV